MYHVSARHFILLGFLYGKKGVFIYLVSYLDVTCMVWVEWLLQKRQIECEPQGSWFFESTINRKTSFSPCEGNYRYVQSLFWKISLCSSFLLTINRLQLSYESCIVPWVSSSWALSCDISGCFAGLGYLSLYLAGKLSLFDKRGYSSRVFFVLFPQLVAVLIAISRVNDYQHRWVDIIGAAILGEGLIYHRESACDSFCIQESTMIEPDWTRGLATASCTDGGCCSLLPDSHGFIVEILLQSLTIIKRSLLITIVSWNTQHFLLHTSVTGNISQVSMPDHGVSLQGFFLLCTPYPYSEFELVSQTCS